MPITLHGVRFGYHPDELVLAGIDMELRPGDLVAVTGPSGSGKSTLLQIIGGLLNPQGGTIENRPRPQDVGWVFQIPTALGRRTALDNVIVSLLGERIGERQYRTQALGALESVGLSGKAHQPAHSLSGGELQRVQLARALVSAPPLVIADEPTAQLDRRSTEAVLRALVRARAATSTVVIATHDNQVAQACDRRLRLVDGVITGGH